MKTTRRWGGSGRFLGALGWLGLLGVAALGGCSRNDVRIEAEPALSSEPVAGTPACPRGLPGASLVLVPGPGESHYCIDARETTRGEYDAFLESKGGETSGQPDECAWNDSYTPALFTEGQWNEVPEDLHFYCPHAAWEDVGPNEPVSCVDFCDALAYCEWAGKRLCGRVGGAKQWGRIYHGYDQSSTIADVEAIHDIVVSVESELFNACSQGGLTRYSFGNEPEPGRCIDATWLDEGGSLEVTSAESRDCHGQSPPFDAIHDLSGSVREWQNFCGYWPGGRVSVIGCTVLVSSRNKLDPMDCASFGSPSLAKAVEPSRGFRCCADSVLVP